MTNTYRQTKIRLPSVSVFTGRRRRSGEERRIIKDRSTLSSYLLVDVVKNRWWWRRRMFGEWGCQTSAADHFRGCFSFVSICVCAHVPPLQSRINWWRQRSCCFFFISFSRTPGERERDRENEWKREREEKEEIQEEFDHQKPNDERPERISEKQSSDREVRRVNDDIWLAIRDRGTYRWQTRARETRIRYQLSSKGEQSVTIC